MIVAPQAGEGAAKGNVDDVPAAGVAIEGAASVNEGGDEKEHVQDLVDSDAAQGAVTAAQGDDNDVQRDDALEPTIPSLITPTPPPQPPQDLPSSSQVQHTPPQSPQPQP
nr:hypothetical protein [Tanacetum cinerariifolium]